MKPNFFLASLMAMCFTINAFAFDNLDFDKALDNGDIYFVPFKEDQFNRGYVWFRDYFYQYTPPRESSGPVIKTITVNLYPTSYENGSYKTYANEHGLRPRNKYLLPDNAVLCEPTEALTILLNEMSYSSLTRLPQGFPRLCGLRIRYMATSQQEDVLVALLNDKAALKVDIKILNPDDQASEGITVDVPALMRELDDKSLLTPYPPEAESDTPAGENENQPADTAQTESGQQISMLDLHFYSSRMDPSLYGLAPVVDEADFYRVWRAFVGLFNPIPDQDGLLYITDEQASSPLVFEPPSVPEPVLSIQL